MQICELKYTLRYPQTFQFFQTDLRIESGDILVFKQTGIGDYVILISLLDNFFLTVQLFKIYSIVL